MSNPRIKEWRNTNQGVVVTLAEGLSYIGVGRHQDVFRTPREAREAIKAAVRCDCAWCQEGRYANTSTEQIPL